MKKWIIYYNELTPMGLESSADRQKTVCAKTKRGALGIYNREIKRGPESAYATTLYKIELVEE